AGTTDPDPINNSATDVDTLTPEVDLAITKDDGVTTFVQGGFTTYTIVVSNAGPSTAVDAVVSDLFSPADFFLPPDWTAVASPGPRVPQPSGVGATGPAVTLLPGGPATSTVIAQISPGFTGALTNTATVSPTSELDTNPGNNSATDIDLLAPPAIKVVKLVNGDDADTPTGPHVSIGSTLTFTYVVTNTAPVPFDNVVVTDDLLGPITIS